MGIGSHPERPRVLVAGAGMAGLAAALSALEAGADVVLLSRSPAVRSPSCAYRGALNASKGSVDGHVADALGWGGPGAQAEALRRRAEGAAGLAEWLARAGLPFDRGGEGLLRHRLPGASEARALSAGAGFGRQVLHALDARLRTFEARGRLIRAEAWHVAALLLPGGHCAGVAAVQVHGLEARAFGADAVVLATGGAGARLSPSTCALEAGGAPLGLALAAGAAAVDADRLAWTPAVPGPLKDLPLPPLLVSAGAVVAEDSLDLRGLSKTDLRRWGGTFPRLAAAFSGRNPFAEALPLRRAVAGTLGGLEAGPDMTTSLPGLLVAGEAAWGGFGARALPGDEALAWLHQGLTAGRTAAGATHHPTPPDLLEAASADLQARVDGLLARRDGAEPGARLAALSGRLSEALEHRTGLEALEAELAAWSEAPVRIGDPVPHANAGLVEALDLPSTLAWAGAMVAAARTRMGSEAPVRVRLEGGAVRTEALP